MHDHGNCVLMFARFRMLFFYIFIPYLQQELDVFRDRYNKSQKRRDKNKILPHGPPTLIFQDASAYGWQDFKVCNTNLPAVMSLLTSF